MRQRSQRALLRAAWVLCALSAGCNAIDSARLSPLPVVEQVDGGRTDGGLDGGADAGPPQRECLGLDELDTCTRPNAVTTCSRQDGGEARCVVVQCVGGFVDCNGQDDDGCEATLSSTAHCGFCNAPCRLANGITVCSEGTCMLEACEDGFDDCDGDPSNGCETSLNTLQNCGSCNKVCDGVDNGAPGCIAGRCGVGTCLAAFGDCDGMPGNGCEEPLVGDNCGSCGLACSPSHANGDCETGACVVDTCKGDYRDCNGLPNDGCEATLDTPDNCGQCGASCELPHADALKCDPSAVAKCSVDHGCPAGSSSCTDGALENGCSGGFGDCNALAADGCEASLTTLVNCGACGEACEIPNAITSCATGSCELVACEPGYGQCTAGGPCVSLASDRDNCGVCGNTCDAGESCYGGHCTPATCAADRADCNGDGSCETVITSTASCGLCDVSCDPVPHATVGCTAGRCEITGCTDGWQDCDGAAHNGCEIDVHSLDTCGSCTMGCVIPGAVASCSTGTCTPVQCNPDRANCNTDNGDLDGCETNITLPESCGKCGMSCGELPNVLSGGCSDKQCQIICKPGFADCDNNRDNGCEADLRDPKSCGSCNVDCSKLANVASASCGAQGCGDIVCAPGFADCDGVAGNGCERSIRTLTNCGACDKPCAPAHATASCSTGTCRIDQCDPGFDNCDTQLSNGCEASLGSPDSCGGCTNQCQPGWACTNGNCQCTTDAQCGSGEECCNGECTNTDAVCSWWPCPIASTNRDTVNCDSCNSDCRLLGAQWCCAL